MSKIKLDIASIDQVARYPRHGWAVNSQGVKLLWLPITNVLAFWNPSLVRRSKGVENLNEHLVSTQPFEGTLQKLIIALRELHRHSREATEIPDIDLNALTKDQQRASTDTAFIVPLFVDVSLMYLRILADHFVDASRTVLFEKFGSAPTHYKGMRPFLRDAKRLAHARPIVDQGQLRKAFDEHSAWFDTIRHPQGGSRGLRDALEHHPVITQVSFRQVAGESPELLAHLITLGATTPVSTELTSVFVDSVVDLCGLWTEVCAAIGWKNGYEEQDCFPMVGLDDDIVGFWPEI